MTTENGATGGDVKDVNANVETQEGQNGGADSANVTAEQLQQQLEELKKASAGKDSKIAELQKSHKELEEIKRQREQDEFAKKSAEEKTQLLQQRLDDLERERILSRELSSLGVSVDDANRVLKGGTAEEQAKALKDILSKHAEKASTASVEELKQKMLDQATKTVPDTSEKSDGSLERMKQAASQY